MIADAHAELMRQAVIEQLGKYNYHDTDGKTYRELVNKLARLRAMEVKVSDPGQGWF